jgi:hypothetical protein
MFRLLFPLALGALYLFAPFPASAGELTVHELKQHRQKYDGTRVQVRGQLDTCGPVWFCAICPEDMTRQTYNDNLCISFAFENQHVRDFDEGADRLDRLTRTAYRFATVTVDASFSSLCMIDEKGNFLGTVVCSDGPANLDDAKVLEVRGRKTSETGGLVDSTSLRVLTTPSGRDAEAMDSEFRLVIGDLYAQPHKLFAVTPNATDLLNKSRGDTHVIDGLACVCREQSCENRWPSHTASFSSSPFDPYRCWGMQKLAVGWRVLPGSD